VIKAALVSAVIASLTPFHATSKPLSDTTKTMLKKNGYWHKGCPVGLNDLRVLRVTYRGFDKHNHTGQIITNKTSVGPLSTVFHKLYNLHFPIRHMSIEKTYGTAGHRSKEPDPTGSFECRNAVPSPCSGGKSTGNWSNHAYGRAIDVNPVENPYVGCGMSRDPLAQKYRDRSRHRPGMVTAQVRSAFASIGWGWGGSWSGNTKDYMHFSVNGH
jgi:hypothetical protein